MRLVACLLPAFGALGCDHFRVESFHGSKMVLTLAGARPTAPGHHLELWARESTGHDDQRVSRLTVEGRRPDLTPCAAGEICPTSAYVITQAVAYQGTGATFQPTDGCQIDALGNLQWTAGYHPDLTAPACNCQPAGATPRSRPAPPDTTNSVGPQGDLGAAAVLRRMHQITDLAPSPLLVFASFDDAATAKRPPVQPELAPADRLQACCDYWCDSPAAYSGNVYQLSAPIHGALYGALDFQSVAPAQLLSGISLTSDYALHDIVELWITDTTASVAGLDPQQLDCGHHPESCVGSVLVDSIPSGPTETGRSLLHFDLRPPTAGGPSGSAVVEIRLDEDPQQF